MSCGCNGEDEMTEYQADSGTETDANVANPICDSSPESYARSKRMNHGITVGMISSVLGALVAPRFSSQLDTMFDRVLVGLGVGSMALMADYGLMGSSVMNKATTQYQELCPAYTGGGETGEEEVDDADVQP